MKENCIHKDLNVYDNKDKKMVSIIIPAYNASKYIEACIDSIFAQTYRNFEVIIAEDKSTDNTVEILEKIKEKYSETNQLRILYFEKNSGESGARNACMCYATGEYTWFVDADDIVSVDALERMVSIAQKTDADLVQVELHRFRDVNDTNVFIKRDVDSRNEGIDVRWYCPNEIEKRVSLVTCIRAIPSHRNRDAFLSGVAGSLYKKDIIEGLSFKIGLHSGADKYFIQDVVCKKLVTKKELLKISVIEEPLYFVRTDSEFNTGHRVVSMLQKKNSNIVCCNWLKILKLAETIDEDMEYQKAISLKNVIKSSIKGGRELQHQYLIAGITELFKSFNKLSIKNKMLLLKGKW